MVGCVIVKDNEIIGEGYHQEYGSHHAEINALHSVADPSRVSGSTVYVNLEPCSHHGKTPPCASALITHKVARVVVSCRDPFSEVNGSGINQLKTAGIEVIENVLEEEGQVLNRRFFTFHQKKRPYVILKWGQSSDGYIAPDNPDRAYWITNKRATQFSHILRRTESAILVGKNTVINDNPHLTTRLVTGKNPVRIVLDSNLKTRKSEYKVYDSSAQTLLINKEVSKVEGHLHLVKSDMSIANILKELHQRDIQSVIVEGGNKVLTSFIQSSLWDEAHIITSNKVLTSGTKAPILEAGRLKKTESVDDNIIQHYSHA